MKNKKVLRRTAKADPKDGLAILIFSEGFGLSFDQTLLEIRGTADILEYVTKDGLISETFSISKTIYQREHVQGSDLAHFLGGRSKKLELSHLYNYYQIYKAFGDLEYCGLSLLKIKIGWVL